MTDPEITLSDDGWTGDLVPPLAQPPHADTDPKPDPSPNPDNIGPIVDVYSAT